MATNQQKLDRTSELVERYLDVKLSDIAGKVLDAPARDAKTGKTTTLRRKVEWLAHEQHKVDRVLENQAALDKKLNTILELLAPEANETEQP